MPSRVLPVCSQAVSRAAARAPRNAASAAGSMPAGRQSPGGRGGGGRAEDFGMVVQQREVGDRLAAVGEHHRQIGGDPARFVAGAARAEPTQGVAEGLREAGGVGEAASRRDPAWLTTPRPSVETTSRGRDPVVCT